MKRTIRPNPSVQASQSHRPRPARLAKRAATVAILVLVTALVLSAAGVGAETRTAMRRGTVFFAPANDSQNHTILSRMNTVGATELYTTWGEIEKEEGVYDWSSLDAFLPLYEEQGKKVALRIAAASFSINDTPSYVFTKYQVRRIAPGLWLNFENGNKEYVLGSGTGWAEGEDALAGQRSLSVSGTRKDFLATGAARRLTLEEGYSVQFDYAFDAPGRLVVRVEGVRNGEPLVRSYPLEGDTGSAGSWTVEFSPEEGETDTRVTWSLEGGRLRMDNINVIERKSGYHIGTLTFPNYFDPTFRTLYDRFVAALADHYRDNPTVDSICIGGYGRWEEITLCDDIDLFALEDQWESYGYSDPAYIDHIRWCIDTYLAAFPDKHLFMCAIGYPGADRFRDQTLIDWKITGYLARHGVGIKYNGWQSKSSEWGSDTSAIFYQVNRYKHDPAVTTYFEEGGQVNNTLSEIMGHPLSVVNRAITDGIDYYWIYSLDILDPYFNRYLQYANEAAGSALFSQGFTIFGQYPYISRQSGTRYIHNNQFALLYHVVDRPETKAEFVEVDGLRAVRSTAGNPRIALSLDDRQKYNGMYGSVLHIRYLDQGTDSFDVLVFTPQGGRTIGTVKKTGTGEWKTASFVHNGFTNHPRSGGKDMPREIEIHDREDGVETIRDLFLEYVPARDFREELRTASEPVGTAPADGIDLSEPVSLRIETGGQSVSSLALPVSPSVDYAYVNIKARVLAQVGGEEILVTTKDHFMPEPGDWFRIPVAFLPEADAYVVELRCDQGQAAWLRDAEGDPAYRVYAFAEGDEGAPASFSGSTALLRADAPFQALLFEGAGLQGAQAVLERRLPDGTFAPAAQGAALVNDGPPDVRQAWTIRTDSGTSARLSVEPQPAGVYRVVLSGGDPVSVAPVELVRQEAANPPSRFLTGDPEPAWQDLDRASLWTVRSGLSDAVLEEGVFRADVAGIEPVLETSTPFSAKADTTHQFHAVLQNGTGSSLMRLYWKTDAADEYGEANSVLVPVVPNDPEFREYTFQVGSERTWKGTITGLRLVPVVGPSETGALRIRTLDLRKGFRRYFPTGTPLDIADVAVDGGISLAGIPTTGEASPTPAASPTEQPGTGGTLPLGTLLPILAAAVAAAVLVFLVTARLAGRGKRRTKN